MPLRAIERLAHVYGPIIKFRVFGEEMIAIGDFELFDEVCDETRFYKLLSGPLAQARDESGTAGLFTQKVKSALRGTLVCRDLTWKYRPKRPMTGNRPIEF